MFLKIKSSTSKFYSFDKFILTIYNINFSFKKIKLYETGVGIEPTSSKLFHLESYRCYTPAQEVSFKSYLLKRLLVPRGVEPPFQG